MRKYKIKIGFVGKELIDDFILTPCLCYSNATDKNATAYALGLKFGYWAVYIALMRKIDGKS